MINKLFGAMLAAVVGLALFPVILDSIATITDDGNATVIAALPTGVYPLISILPLLYIVILAVGIIAAVKFKR